MYLQIKLRPDNCKYFWFLDLLKEPSYYEFQRLGFGLNSAPFEAQYIFQKNAEENQKEFPLAVETVL